jgi:hypothetical protein
MGKLCLLGLCHAATGGHDYEGGESCRGRAEEEEEGHREEEGAKDGKGVAAPRKAAPRVGGGRG